MINLNDMVIFAKVAELQGISPAARALNMPKSKVSRRMAELEVSLGVRLLERSTRAVHLTEAGQLYWQHCQRIVEEADSAVESINQLSESPRGSLRISASVATGQYLIAPHLAEFMSLYPDIDLTIELNNRRVDVIAEGYDLVIRIGELNDSALISKRLGSAHSALYAAPNYLERYGEPANLDELAQHKILSMSAANRSRYWLLENDVGEQLTPNINSCLNINDFHCLKTVLEQGAGIANMPVYLVDELVKQGKLKHILPEWRSPVIHYYTLYPSHRGLTPKARAWMDFYQGKIINNTP